MKRAETYVDAVESKEWKAACEVSVREGLDACADLLEAVYTDGQTQTPTVKQTEAVVEKVDGRNLVNCDYTVIR